MDVTHLLYTLEKFKIDFIQVGSTTTVKLGNNGFIRVFSIQCGITRKDLSKENQYFIILEDSNGHHCIDWSKHLDYTTERLETWISVLETGVHKNLIEYSFPDILPVKTVVLNPFSANPLQESSS